MFPSLGLLVSSGGWRRPFCKLFLHLKQNQSGRRSGQSEIEAAEVLSKNMEKSTSAQNDENTFDKMLVKEEIVEVGRKASKKRKLTGDLKHHYYYFCLDCEVDQPGSKVPITLDIASHIMERGHVNFQPISEVFPDRGHVLVENITFNLKFNKKVCLQF